MHSEFKLELQPKQQIVALAGNAAFVDGRRWRAFGSDPAFDCHWNEGETLAGGWYLLKGDFSVSRGKICAPVVYPDYGSGTHEYERVNLPLAVDSGTTEHATLVVRMVAPVKGLRFDPSVVPTEFESSPLSMRKLGRKEALSRLLSAVWKAQPDAAHKLRICTKLMFNLLAGGLSRMADRLYLDYSTRFSATLYSDYEVWQEFYDALDESRIQAANAQLAALSSRPLVSLLLPTYNTPERWLRLCIESVQKQHYPNWELCIADDASTDSRVREIIEEYARTDQRIKYVFRPVNGHISEASNSALSLATGHYSALLDHDDELHPFALLECVDAFQKNPQWRMLFTDEDKIDVEGKRSDPYFKSDWNPDLFLSQNCVCHLTIYETGLVSSIGGFRKGFEGAQDWDLTLRVTQHLSNSQIGHVAKVLYHWRMIEGSTAMAPGEKSYAHLAAMRAIEEHLLRIDGGARVHEMPGYSGYFRIEYPLPEPPPLVSLLIPTRDRIDLLKQCIDSIIEKTDYPNFEVIVIDNDSQEQESKEYFDNVQSDPRVRVVHYPQPFNYSAINNFGAQHARGSVFGLLNNDIEVISRSWLNEMVGHALRPEIGVVGAMLYYPNDRIQHAGVILGIGGVAGHCYVGMERGWPGDKHRGGLAQSLSAVTAACAIVRKSVFEQVNGLDEKLEVAFNDVDFCLRVRREGYRNLWTPFAELYHHESASRGYETTPSKIARFKREESLMKERWGESLRNDPYYNVNLSLTSAPFTLSYPPRYMDDAPTTMLPG